MFIFIDLVTTVNMLIKRKLFSQNSSDIENLLYFVVALKPNQSVKHQVGKVDVARIKHGNRQTLETLINEEALLLAKYLRNERDAWSPRMAIPS